MADPGDPGPGYKTFVASADADLIIQVGKPVEDGGNGVVGIKTNGAIMRAGSGFFRDMLKSDIGEQITRVIELPEEDTVFFPAFCALLHRELPKEKMDPDWFCVIAKIANTRDSIATLKGDIKLMLEPVFDEVTKQSFRMKQEVFVEGHQWRIDHIISIAGLFGFDRVFFHATKCRLLTWHLKVEAFALEIFYTYSGLGALGRVYLTDAFQAKSRDIHNTFDQDLRQCIAKATNLAPADVGPSQVLPCKRAQTYWNAFLNGFANIGDHNVENSAVRWPCGPEADDSILSLVRKIQSALDNRGASPITDKHSTTGGYCTTPMCTLCPYESAPQMYALTVRCLHNIPGMCLECFKQGEDDCWTVSGCPRHHQGDVLIRPQFVQRVLLRPTQQ